MNLTVDQDKCCAAGACALSAPTVFDQSDEDGTVVLLNPTPPAAESDAVREAVDSCPSGAIELT